MLGALALLLAYPISRFYQQDQLFLLIAIVSLAPVMVNRLGSFGGSYVHEATFLVAWLLSVTMAGLSFRFFERPILEFKNRFRVTGGAPRDTEIAAKPPTPA